MHTWLRHYASGGLGGLADRSSRPGSCPHQMPPAVEARIAGLRRAHPAQTPTYRTAPSALKARKRGQAIRMVPATILSRSKIGSGW
jgi:Homeodomain-like domain